MYVNLLPASYRQQTNFRQAMRLWLRTWAATCAVCIVVGWWQYSHFKSTKQRVARTVNQVTHLHAVHAEVSDLRVAIAGLRSKIEHMSKLLPPDDILLICRQICKGVKLTDDTLQLKELKAIPVTQTVSIPTGGEKKVQLTSSSTAVLSGLALDDQAISRLVSELRKAQVFSKVTLKGSSHVSLPHGSARQFQVECTY